MAHLGVDGVGKVNRCGTAGQRQHTTLWGKGVHLHRVEVHLERREKFAGLLHLLDPLDQLAHPHDALVIGFGDLRAVLVLPVSGNTLLGDAVHFLRADLHLEGLPGVNDGGVQRLVEVGPWHRDVVLEAAGDRMPYLMDDAECAIATADRISDDAESQQVVDLIQRSLLALDFLVDGVKTLDAAFHLGRNAVFDQLAAEIFLHIVEKLLEGLGARGHFFLELEIGGGFQVAEGQVLQFAADQTHAQPVGNRSVDIECLPRDALLLFGREETQGAHVVEPIA